VFALAQDARKYDTPSMEAWYVQQGGNAEKFRAAFNAFGVQNKVQIARQLTQKMGIESVPMLIVEGRYHVLGDSFEEQIANLDALIAELRKSGGKKG
jgi:thiol:disulfide interchange protein DsbA